MTLDLFIAVILYKRSSKFKHIKILIIAIFTIGRDKFVTEEIFFQQYSREGKIVVIYEMSASVAFTKKTKGSCHTQNNRSGDVQYRDTQICHKGNILPEIFNRGGDKVCHRSKVRFNRFHKRKIVVTNKTSNLAKFTRGRSKSVTEEEIILPEIFNRGDKVVTDETFDSITFSRER